MSHPTLDYAAPPQQKPAGDVAVILAAISPFVMVPIFFVGTALIQDDLVNGDGRSWFRAALRFAIPTGIVTAVALLYGVVALRRSRRRIAAILATVFNALALAFIVYATTTA